VSLARTRRTVPVCVLALSFFVIFGLNKAMAQTPPPPPPAPAVAQMGTNPVAPAKPAPKDLATITYQVVPDGFPLDPGQTELAPITDGLHASRRLPLYDAPGGNPRAFLPPDILGVPVTVPIVARQPGWVAVLLPSINRRIGWLPATGWQPRPLRDQLVVHLARHELTWLHDGVRQDSWTVATGSDQTPTPRGRTFVLGRTETEGSVYGGLDALVLGAVPDDRDAVAPGLRDAHTGIHSWHSASAFGRSVSNGCVRVPRDGQRTLLDHIGPGTPVVVLS
jgi:hypothetical protein